MIFDTQSTDFDASGYQVFYVIARSPLGDVAIRIPGIRQDAIAPTER